MRKRRGSAAGYTLAELLVVIAIIAILGALGVSSYKSVTTQDRMLSELNDLNGDIELARSTAIKQGVNVTICAAVTASATNASNTSSCSGSETGWNSGWIVFTDVNGTNGTSNQTYVTGTGDTLVRIHPALQGGDIVTTTLPSLTFNRMGGTANAGTLSLHDAKNTSAWTRCVAVSQVGLTEQNTASSGPNPGSCP
jgi:type IV fimbrial biogenesis protein FimT